MHSQVRGLLALLLIASSASVATAQGPKFKPNAVKYKNVGAKPATGRSGSASLQVRALMAKDGTMQVEASTGSLEDGTNPGSIAKVQVKAPGFVKNYNGLTGNGYWTATYPTATRNASIQVQANVTGIDPKRTDVVTVSTPAVLRPDVKVNSVAGAAQSAPNSPVHFTAAVSETNGDVGARADCVLSVDGTPVMTNQGIWVDAASTVSCAFDYAFPTAGTYTVRVSANNVVPGDWDLTNNQAETSITILAPGQKIQQGYFYAQQYNVFSQYTNYYYYGSTYKHDFSNAGMGGATQAKADRVQRVDAKLYRDGSIQHSVSLTPSSTWEYNDGYREAKCGSYSDWTSIQVGDTWEYATTGDYMDMCTYGTVGDPSSYWSNFYYTRITGEVTYDYSSSYWYYNKQHYTYGTGVDLGWNAGSTIRLKVNFVDIVGAMFDADQSLVLEDFSSYVNHSDYYYTSSGRYYRGYIHWNNQ